MNILLLCSYPGRITNDFTVFGKMEFLATSSHITIAVFKMYFQNTLKSMTLHIVENDSSLWNFKL